MNIICPKCKQAVFVPENKDYVICCGEVIFVVKNTSIVQGKGR